VGHTNLTYSEEYRSIIHTFDFSCLLSAQGPAFYLLETDEWCIEANRVLASATLQPMDTLALIQCGW
jgi:hypothetical protein